MKVFALGLSAGAVCSVVFFWILAGHFAKASIVLACVGVMAYLTLDLFAKRGKE